MKIIDVHAHLGYDYVFDEESTEENLLYYYDRYGVTGAIVQPFTGHIWKIPPLFTTYT